MSRRRSVITGMGIKSPVGNTIESAWDNIVNGRSGIGPITNFDCGPFGTKISGEVRNFDVTDYLPPKDARKMDPFIHYGLAAAMDAVKDSGLDFDQVDRTRVGVSVGSGIGGISTIEKTNSLFEKSGPRKISPFFVPSTIINMVSGHLSILYGLKGPNLAMVTACTTATHNIGLAQRLIAYGDADVMIVGGTEYSASACAVGGFVQARALSTRNDDPTKASRPWDKDRDGFVLSDGAGVLVVEELEHARRRGAPILAEIKGFGMSGDAYHITAPPEGGAGAAQCMTSAMADAGLAPEQISYVNAHGTSTLVGDRAECDAIKSSFGAAADSVAVSSTKSMTGHLLGAAGGVEAIFGVLALRDQVLPPTINLDNPDEGCDLDFVPHEARQSRVDLVMSNSFGFGGTNGTLILGKVD
ncbi:MAG: beta-ketoacyl-ACP synthase II [Xanthomonadales bacterium]|nr:beta-ketoacyl-ACP synthase II [Xanthomonadales bacterium]